MTAQPDEQTLRYDLMIAHHLTHYYKMDELVWNHISARCPSPNPETPPNDQTPSYLITPGRKTFNMIRPEHFTLCEPSENITSDVIHSSIYVARPDVNAIVHLHTPGATAIGCLKDGYRPISQDGAHFFNRVAIHPWEGISDDLEEGERLKINVCSPSDACILMMPNHGFSALGGSIAEAWVLAYYFEKSCTNLMNAYSSGQPINWPGDDVMNHAKEQSLDPMFRAGNQEWEGLKEMIEEKYLRF